MRLILDTNILVSAFVFKSETANSVVRIAAKTHILLFSESTFKELKSTLLKQKFLGFVELPIIRAFLFNLVRIGEFIEPKIEITECRDPKDNKFLELAIAGNADCIVTGDKDLLVLNMFLGIKIVSPSDFLIQY
ncbi:MAG: putative toxin-antitoxin system toxin component, PIN family [Salinivirgaceae bacterium]|jgi:hypothetical protein